MRVEHLGTTKSIPETPHRQGLAQGDILVAEVTDIKGDQVVLKNQDGSGTLTAKLLSDIAVSIGDFVETVVDEASGGRYVLRVIDISRQMPFGSDDLETLTTQNQSVRAQALLNTLAMLKNNPGADPKAAAFLSRHGIAGSAENIETVSQMAKGASILTVMLAELIESFGINKEQSGSLAPAAQPAANTVSPTAQPVTVADPLVQAPKVQTPANSVKGNAVQASAVVQSDTQKVTGTGLQAPIEAQVILQPIAQESPGAAGQSAGQTMPAGIAVPNTGASLAQAVQAMTEAAVQIQSTDGQTTSANQAITQAVFQPSAEAAAQSANAAENTAAVLHPSALETAVKTDTPDMVARTHAPLGEAQNMKTTGMTDKISKMPEHITAAPKEISEQITDKALAMFMSLEDADELALHLKKAVQNLPEQLKELKVLIEHADNIVKETVAAKFDQIEKQMSIMNEVRRFDCYQIPLQNSQHQLSAAELYVYRYRNGKKKVDPENILILLGLDTQYMGRVETLIKTNGKSLSIEFNLEDMRLSDEIQADTAHLEQTVNEAGYHLAGVSVKPLTSRTTVLNAENRFENETGGSAGNVDVRI